MRIERKLEEMGMPLPEAPAPVASYVPAVRTGNLAYCSGQLPTRSGTLQYRGRVPEDIGEEEATEAARTAALNALAAIQAVVGDLDRIRRVVRLTGYVNSAMDFTNQPAVINGASDFLVDLFGEAGQHSRVSVGVFQLPLGATVEVDLIVEVE
jgi:enamine deaminase RidA (YjgF/YER057c/UK114 family)